MRRVKRWAAFAISILLLADVVPVHAASLQEAVKEAEVESAKRTTEPVDNFIETLPATGTTTDNGTTDTQDYWEDNSTQTEDEEWYDVNLEEWYYELAPGEVRHLVVYTNAPANEITYTSSDETVATVSDSGVITAVSGGAEGWASTTITVTRTSPSGRYTTSSYCTVDVKNTLTLDKESYTIYTKQKKEYKLTATSNPVGTITWTSSNPKIATVSSTGVITPKKAGNTTITATANGVSASCQVTVEKPFLRLDSTATAYLKNKVQLNAEAGPNTKITWKTSNPKVATVNAKGVVTGKKKGTVTITAKANGITKKCKVTVEAPSITMYQNSLSIFAGSTYDMYAYAKPETATIKWKSSNKKIVKVNENGTLTAVKPGKAKVTASIGGAKVVCEVKVVKDTYKLSSTKRTMTAGEEISLYVKNLSDASWVSYNQVEYTGAVDTYTEGNVCRITANHAGTAKIMVSFSVYKDWNYTYYRKPCTIKVVDSGISQQQFSIAKGKTKALEMVNIGESTDIASITWSSTAPKVAAVNAATGVVKGIKTGTAKINATVVYTTGETKTYTSTVKVSNPKFSASKVVVALQGTKAINLKGVNEYSDIQWKTSKKSVVTVSADGTLNPVKKGNATIKAVVDGKTLSCKVYVSNPKLESTYARRVVGAQVKVPIKGLNAKSKVTYKSSNSGVAKVDKKGNITTVGGGRAEILVNADGREFVYVVEVASQRAISACELGYSIITTSTYSQALRMSDGYYDCSALVFKAYGRDAALLGGSSSWAPTAAGMAQHMAATGKVIAWEAVSIDQLRPGDLIFYGQQNNGRYLGIYHVSMYYGDYLRLESPLSYYYERDNIVMVARPVP